jgi:hypothetical protein
VPGVADRFDEHEPDLGEDLQVLRDGGLGQPGWCWADTHQQLDHDMKVSED